MNKETLIENKVNYLERQIKKLKRGYGVTKIILTIFGGLGIGLTASMLFGNPLGAMGYALLTAISHMFYRYISKISDIETEDLEKVKVHLEELLNKEINDSEELNSKRKSKIKSLKKSEKKTKKTANKDFRKILLSTGISAIGTALPYFLNPVVGILVTGLGLIGIKVKTNDSIDSTRKNSRLNARISNLENDLDIINVQKGNKRASKKQKNNKDTQATNNSTKKKVKVQTSEQPVNRKVQSNAIDKEIEAINKYISGLERQKEEERHKYYSKY